MAKRKAAPRSRSRQTRSAKNLWPWIMALVLTIGGIGLYENRASVFPKSFLAFNSSKKSALSAKPSAPASVKPVPRSGESTRVTRREAAPSSGPIPPLPVGQGASAPAARQSPVVTAAIPAAIPADRPLLETMASQSSAASGTEQKIKAGTHFSFCGRSGLKNCVEDGRVFWREGKRQVLATITVARTDEAACSEERRKGFAAKVRLRDFLNQGDFLQASSNDALSISRGGQRFEDQLLREGLAFPVAQKNQSWCG